MVEAVLLGEEVFQRHIAAKRSLVEIANVTARTKGAKWTFFVAATHHHGPYLRIVLPLLQHVIHLAHHRQ